VAFLKRFTLSLEASVLELAEDTIQCASVYSFSLSLIEIFLMISLPIFSVVTLLSKSNLDIACIPFFYPMILVVNDNLDNSEIKLDFATRNYFSRKSTILLQAGKQLKASVLHAELIYKRYSDLRS